MSEPTPEYDLEDPIEQRRFEELEPGMPDEAVAEYITEPAPAVGFNVEFASEFAPLGMATLLAMAVVEAVLKPMAKGLFDVRYNKQRKEDPKLPEARDTSNDKNFIRALAFGAGCGTSVTFGFRAMVYDLTGITLSVLEEVLYGGASVAVCSLVVYMLIEEMRPVKALKVFIRGIYDMVFRRFVGREMTDEEKAELEKTQKRPPVTPEDLEALNDSSNDNG